MRVILSSPSLKHAGVKLRCEESPYFLEILRRKKHFSGQKCVILSAAKNLLQIQ